MAGVKGGVISVANPLMIGGIPVATLESLNDMIAASTNAPKANGRGVVLVDERVTDFLVPVLGAPDADGNRQIIAGQFVRCTGSLYLQRESINDKEAAMIAAASKDTKDKRDKREADQQAQREREVGAAVKLTKEVALDMFRSVGGRIPTANAPAST